MTPHVVQVLHVGTGIWRDTDTLPPRQAEDRARDLSRLHYYAQVVDLWGHVVVPESDTNR